MITPRDPHLQIPTNSAASKRSLSSVILSCLFLSHSLAGIVCSAPPDDPLPLSKAREVGRERSTLLNSGKTVVNGPPKANLAGFKANIAPVLKKACTQCHGPEKMEGNIRIDTLDPNLLEGEDVKWWIEVLDVLSKSEMPPEDADVQLSNVEVSRVVEWLTLEIQKASRTRHGDKQHTSFRRLARYEYNYAMQDLLGLPHSFSEKLPPETASEDGFKNSSPLLQMSSMQFEHYREIALKGLKRAIVVGERPKPVTYVISMKQELAKEPKKEENQFNLKGKAARRQRNRFHFLDLATGEGLRVNRKNWAPKPGGVVVKEHAAKPVVLALPRGNQLKLNLDRFLPDEGIMRVRIRAACTDERDKAVASLRLMFSAHTSNNANFSQMIGKRNVELTVKPQFIDFFIPLSQTQRNPFRKLKRTFPRRDEFLHIHNDSSGKNPPQLLIDYIEISAPFYAQWPPKTHTDIFVESENRSNEDTYAHEVIEHFLERAWRRRVLADDVLPFVALFKKYRPEFATFEEAMVEVLSTVLATPEFLYLTQRVDADKSGTQSLNDSELASRLSFFLWSSVPDAELLKLAREGKLKDAKKLDAQIDRMLKDPRAKRFAQQFVRQWLGLDGLNSVTHIKDSLLREAMEQEPIEFFRELLKRNGSVLDFIHSDYVVINAKLAQHYQIDGVEGPQFRTVPVSADVNRGGVLTGGAVLSMNSDGKDSHPLKRGIWLLEHILHDPPPPPPPNVPEVDLTDPRILQMTLKERIADHRNKAACRSCHAKIDPWGVAFENYDALGRFRAKINQRPVDATSELFNKQELAGVEGLKRYLLTSRQDQFCRALVHKMSAFALGRPLTFSDRSDIDQLTVEFRKKGDRLGDLVKLIINSELFRAKGMNKR